MKKIFVLVLGVCFFKATSQTVTSPCATNAPQLQIVPSATSICAGSTVNLSTQSSNVSQYSWNNGSHAAAVLVAPSTSTTYSVTGVNADGCSTTTWFKVIVNALPDVEIISDSAICEGQFISLSALSSGASSYKWSNGENTSYVYESLTMTTAYSLSVTNVYGCTAVASKIIMVNALPQLQVVASEDIICKGQTVTLYAAGGDNELSYFWSNNLARASEITVTPSVSTDYYVNILDANNCFVSGMLHIEVSKCTGIEKNAAGQQNSLLIFPNPSSDSFMIKGDKEEKGEIVNSLGQLIRAFNLSAENDYFVKITGLSKGVYFVLQGTASSKVVVN